MKKLSIFPVLFIALAASTASAAIIAQESFDYTAGDLDGNGSSLDPGWDGAWGSGAWGTTNGDISVATPGITYSGMTTTGGLANTSGSWITGFRNLESAVGTDGQSVWISTLINLENGVTTNSGGVILLSGGNNIGNAVFILGDPTSVTSGENAEDWGIGSGSFQQQTLGTDTGINAGNQLLSDVAISGTTSLMVARINFQSGNETVDFWINPNVTSFQASNQDSSFVGTLDTERDFTFDRILIGSGLGGGYRFDIDEVRIGETAADLGFTVIPEPSTVAMLGFALAVLAIGRRRRNG